MKFTTMQTPSSRAEFEERMNSVREQLREQKMHFAEGLRTPDSLLNVRYLPNRRIDLLSIDETARLHANMTYQFRNNDFDGVSEDE